MLKTAWKMGHKIDNKEGSKGANLQFLKRYCEINAYSLFNSAVKYVTYAAFSRATS